MFKIRVSDPLYGNGPVDLYDASGLCLESQACPTGAEISFLATDVMFYFSANNSAPGHGFNISYRTSIPSES